MQKLRVNSIQGEPLIFSLKEHGIYGHCYCSWALNLLNLILQNTKALYIIVLYTDLG